MMGMLGGEPWNATNGESFFGAFLIFEKRDMGRDKKLNSRSVYGKFTSAI